MEPCTISITPSAALHISFGCQRNRTIPGNRPGPKFELKKETHMFEALKTRYSAWKRYNRTIAELSALSNRDLADLGIGRADIGRIARESAR